ncbi:uncharacterized protein EI97DRAFT_53904 [Westerdykella ornata]|uniref:Zn(2)-C6 fungal-type domain-containing protein n=1 Tax=Westerdykella ornata TaxID=318751 RepID=A0A6A6JMV7_WESOR|nr:uncharacterized protein EI97DRAFT_53904 [Westerdykella ornata]KAF2276269.1 hypothetical protein EI97DRAFT_53904 [Westerdykella ornata]
MQILALPPLTSLPPTPLGRREEPVSRLAKLQNQFSPARSGQHSYPSPPMSDSHSPSRRSAHLVEPVYPPYHAPVHDVRRLDSFAPPPLPPPPPPPFDHRPVDGPQHLQHQPPLYPGEAAPAPPHPYSSQSHGFDPGHYGSVPPMQPYYMYPPPHVPAYHSTQPSGPQGALPPAIIPQQTIRQKPARRTKAHVASACVNCKRAHLSCDVQRPCGRCVTSGKQASFSQEFEAMGMTLTLMTL